MSRLEYVFTALGCLFDALSSICWSLKGFYEKRREYQEYKNGKTKKD